MLGQALAYAPNVNSAIISAGRLLDLFKRVPKMENCAPSPFNAVEVLSFTFKHYDFNNCKFKQYNN